jgi:hypothetical protein
MTFKQYISDYDLFLIITEQYQLNESIKIPAKLQKTWDFLHDFSDEMQLNFNNVINIFKDKTLFSLFSKLNWNLKKFIKIIQEGYAYYKQLVHIIGTYIEKNKIYQLSETAVKQIQEHLENHPKLKKISGLVLAGLLIYVWTSVISFVGDTDFDFDQTMLINALTGNYNLVDMFTGSEGAKFLTYVATGALTGISFPWPGSTSALFLGSLVFTFAKNKKIRQAVFTSLKNLR